MKKVLWLLLLFATGCGSVKEKKSKRKKPPFHPPNIEIAAPHPWIALQTDVDLADPFIQEDLLSIDILHQKLNEWRKAEAKQEKTLEEDRQFVITTIKKLQEDLPEIHAPKNWYNVLNIPDQSCCCPYPSKTYKRLYIGKTEIGYPFYLDVRVFSKQNITEVKNWHLKLLVSESFSPLTASNKEVYLGRGDRNVQHFDPTHNFGTKDRGMYLAFIENKENFIVLYADAPWKTFSLYLDDFKQL